MFIEVIGSTAVVAGIILTPLFVEHLETRHKKRAQRAAELRRRHQRELYVTDFFRQISC